MNCKDARKVWGHPEGPVEGVRKLFPMAFERIHLVAKGFAHKLENPFNAAVQKDAKALGVTSYFYVTHGDDRDPVTEEVHAILGDTAVGQEISHYFSKLFGVSMRLGNICCSGCSGYSGDVTPEEIVAIQKAAIKNNPD